MRKVDPVLGLVLSAQLALALPDSMSRTLWLDEAFSAVTSREDWSHIRLALIHDNGPPLHYCLLHFWRQIWGESPLALRSLSTLFASATTILLYRSASCLFGRGSARRASVLWALNPLALHYASEIRMYSAYAFFGLALISSLSLSTPPASWLRGGQVATCTACLLYTHNGAWFALAAVVLAAAAFRRELLTNRYAMVGLASGVLSYFAWLDVLVAQFANGECSLWWMRQHWSVWNPILSLAGFCPYGRPPPFSCIAGVPAHWWLGILVLWLVPLLWSLQDHGTARTAHARFFACFCALGLLLPALWSIVARPIYVPGRIDFALLPVFLLLVAAGFDTFGATMRRWYFALLLALSGFALVARAWEPPARDEAAWVEVLRQQTRPGDLILCSPLTLPQAKFYLVDRELTLLTYPSGMQAHPALFNGDWHWANQNPQLEAPKIVTSTVLRLGRANSLWVISTPGLGRFDTVLRDSLAMETRLVLRRRYDARQMGLQRLHWPIAVLQYTRRSLPTPPNWLQPKDH